MSRHGTNKMGEILSVLSNSAIWNVLSYNLTVCVINVQQTIDWKQTFTTQLVWEP